MAVEILDIVIRERGARKVHTVLDTIAVKAATATRSIFLLERAFFVLGAAGLVKGIQNIVDTYTDMSNRLKLVTKDTADLAGVLDSLFAIANRTRSSFEGTAIVFSRVALSVKALGTSQRETLQFTESLHKAIILSGAGAQEARAALIQLSQGLASNRLSGDELRSVLEQIPFVADIIAKSLGITRGELREFGQTGKLTAETVLKAFREAREEIAEKFAKTIPTIGQSFVVLGNNITQTLGRFNEATGTAQVFATAVIKIANNFETLFNILASGGLLLIISQFANFTAGIVKSTQATIQHNAATVQRIATITATRIAREADIATRVRELQLDQAGLQASLALNRVQQQELLTRRELFRNTELFSGSTVNLKIAIETLNNSMRGLVATEAALLKVNQQLVVEQAALTIASSATASAQARLAAATAAVTLTSRVATVAMNTLRGVLAFFGGPIGLAIGAVALGILHIATRASDAERAISELESQTRELSEAFSEVGGNADKLLDRLETLTLSKAIENANELLDDFNDSFKTLVSIISNELRLTGKSLIDPNDIESAEKLSKALSDLIENNDLSKFRTTLSNIAASSPELLPLVNQWIDLTNNALSAADASERAAAKMRVVAGAATEADRNLLGLNISSEKASDSISKLSEAAKESNERVKILVSGSSSNAQAFTTIERLKEVTLTYNEELASLREERRKGEVSTLDLVGAEAVLGKQFKDSVDGITGYTKALGLAENAVDKLKKTSDTLNQTARDKALSEATSNYQQVVAAIRDIPVDNVEQLAVQQKLLSEAAAAFVPILNSINEEFDKIDDETIKKLGDAKSFKDVTKALEDESVALQNVILNQESLNQISEVSRTLSRGLTADEELLIIAHNTSKEALKNHANALKDNIDPAERLKTSIGALEDAILAGLDKTGIFAQALRILRAELANVNVTASASVLRMRELAMAVPDLAKAISQQEKIARLTQVANEEIASITGGRSIVDVSRADADKVAVVVNLLRQGIDEASGFADRVKDLDEALKGISSEADLSGLDAKNRALAVEAERYGRLRQEIIETGNDQNKLTKLDEDSARIRESILDRYAEKATITAKIVRDAFSFKDARADLNRQTQILTNSAARLDEYNVLLAVSSRLERDLTVKEAAWLLGKVRLNESLARQTELMRNLTDEGPDLQQLFSDLNALYAATAINLDTYNQAMQDATFSWLEWKESVGEASFMDGFLLGLEDLAFGVQDFTSEAGRLFASFTEDMATGFANAFFGILEGTTSVRDAIYQISRQALSSLIAGLVKLGIQYAINAAIGNAISAATTAAQSAQAAALATAYAPAAAAVSLASYGANAAPAALGMVAVNSLAKLLFGGGGVGGKPFQGPGFAHGGSIQVGGTGGVDSQLVAFRASPNERIDVLTPGQAGARDRENNRNINPTNNMTTINNIEVSYTAKSGENPNRSANEVAKLIAERISEVTNRDGV